MNAKKSVQLGDTEVREFSSCSASVLDALPQMVWVNEDEGRTLFYNKRWSDFTGVDVARDPHFDRTLLIHEEDRAAAAEAWAAAQQTGL